MIGATLIIFCLGGSVVDAHERAISGESFAIVGTAASSCTMYLAAADVCVGNNAKFIFHRPAARPGEHAFSDADMIAWGKYISAHYPDGLAAMYMREVIYGGKKLTLGGRELINNFDVEECEK